jgi:phosphoenolpyruvate carboxylase
LADVREVRSMPQDQSPPLRRRLAADLAAHRLAAESDPFANPILAFARDLARRLGDGGADLAELEAAVRTLTVEGFLARAERLGAYLGAPDPGRDRAGLEALFEALAARGNFEAYAAAVARPAYGAVFTGHPTFALNHALSLALVELATGFDRQGQPLDDAGRTARRRLAETTPHGPPEHLTLDLEHDWSVEALENGHDALDTARRAAVSVARRRWPDRWRDLSPQLATLATWVGFDTDGRNDVTWLVSFEKRLDLKRRALLRYRRVLTGASGRAAGEAAALLDGALGTTVDQQTLAAAARADPAEAPAFARAMVAGRAASLVDPAPFARLLEAAIGETADDQACEDLLALRGGLAAQGLSLAQVQVRLNAAQLHSAIRGEIGLGADPADPASRRAHFAAAEALLAKVNPRRISFGSLVDEPAPAKRLMMTLAQTIKTVDAVNPVRFLIAEAESGFTVLAALYYARLYGVEDRVEISPLFETEAGLERGEAVFEEALRSPHYRDHLQRLGRLAVEFGFSDSGRFIGQMAATFRIERLQLRLAELLEKEKLTGIEVVLFDTHGESIGRGGHPRSLADRLRYAAPPRSRAEFTRRGQAVREETSFQGGEGYLPFFTPVAALATVRGVLEFAYGAEPEAEGDPIYKAQAFASDFFATIQQAFSDLVEDPDYAVLLSLFETRLLHRTGSRPEQRQGEGQGRPRTLRHVGELRAIPNNGVLQQLGYLANSVFGVGLAAAKDAGAFAALQRTSPRFSRGFEMVRAAFGLSDLAVIEAYAAVLDPGLWLARRADAVGPPARAFEALAALAATAGLHEPLERVVRTLQAEHLRLADTMSTVEDGRRARLLLLHGVRAGVLQEIARLAGEIPSFPLNRGLSLEQIQERLVRMDVPGAVETLFEVFPLHQPEGLSDADWGEPADDRPETGQGHAAEHETLFKPLLALHALALAITSAITHEIGACG